MVTNGAMRFSVCSSVWSYTLFCFGGGDIMIIFWAALTYVIMLVIWWFITIEFQQIVEMKGYSDKRYFWWTFFLGLIGILMVIALPDRSSKHPQQKEENTSKKEKARHLLEQGAITEEEYQQIIS